MALWEVGVLKKLHVNVLCSQADSPLFLSPRENSGKFDLIKSHVRLLM